MWGGDLPRLTRPSPLAQAAYPDLPYLWLLPDDPYWDPPPAEWRSEADLVLYWYGTPGQASAVAVDIARPGQQLPRHRTILPAGTRLTFEARHLTFREDWHYNGLIPDDLILLRMPDGCQLELCVGYSYHPQFMAAAACVRPSTARTGR